MVAVDDVYDPSLVPASVGPCAMGTAGISFLTQPHPAPLSYPFLFSIQLIYSPRPLLSPLMRFSHPSSFLLSRSHLRSHPFPLFLSKRGMECACQPRIPHFFSFPGACFCGCIVNITHFRCAQGGVGRWMHHACMGVRSLQASGERGNDGFW